MVPTFMPIDIDLNGINGNCNSASALQNRRASTTATVIGKVSIIEDNTSKPIFALRNIIVMAQKQDQNLDQHQQQNQRN